MRLKTDYLLDYLDVAWQTDPDAGLHMWVAAFQQVLDGWQHDECSRLLRELKKAPLTPEIAGLVRYVEGRWSEQKGDLRHAIRCYEESLRLNEEDAQPLRVAQVQTDLGLAYRAIGQLDQAAANLQAALAVYRTDGAEPDALLEVLNNLALIYIEQADWPQAQRCLDEADTMVSAPDEEALLQATRGALHQAQGDWAAATNCYTAALTHFRTVGDQSSVASVLNNLGLLALERFAPGEARQYLLEALTLNQNVGDWVNAAQTLGNLALVAEQAGEYATAIQHYTEAFEQSRMSEDMRAQAIFLNLRGVAYAESGDWRAAAADQEQSLALLAHVNDQATQSDVLNNLGNAYRHLDRLDEAAACYQQALTLAERLGDQRRRGGILGDLGHLYDARGDAAQAQNCYEQSLAIATQVDDPLLESVALLGLASLRFAQGDFHELEGTLVRLWAIGEATLQFDVLIRVCWLWGDRLILADELEAGFEQYAQAVVFAETEGGRY
jgi:tetratricopeptide (TPR) repeat protein